MSIPTAQTASPAGVLTIALIAAAPCEHDWTADGGYVYCHDCGVGGSPSAPPPGVDSRAAGRR